MAKNEKMTRESKVVVGILLLLLIPLAFLGKLMSNAVIAQASERSAIGPGYQTLADDNLLVMILNIEPVGGYAQLLPYGANCTVEWGARLEVVGRNEKDLLLRKAGSVRTGGSICPTGTLFIVSDGWFQDSWHSYSRIAILVQNKEATENATKQFVTNAVALEAQKK